MNCRKTTGEVRYAVRRGRWNTSYLLIMTALFSLVPRTAGAQHSNPDDTGRSFYLTPVPSQLPGPEGLQQYVIDGKLRLSMEEAIRLMLLNNTDLRLSETPVDLATFALLAAHHPFDPAFTSSVSATRSTIPATNDLQGAQVLSTLTQTASVGYSQTLETGTNWNVTYNAGKSSTNDSFYFLNPYFSSGLAFQVTQPLLRNRGLFPNRAPIVIAQRNLKQSKASFEAQMNDAIQRIVSAYWVVVGARENLRVVHDSLAAAEATYKQDKRALELGALPPLDIYRSESQVAQRRVSVIQAEYALKQTEDQFRQLIGADLDAGVEVLDLELTDSPEPQGDLYSVDIPTALDEATKNRPELEALSEQLANDATNIRLAHNGLLPDLELSGNYSSNGIGGNQIDSSVSPPLVIPGGLLDAVSQTFQFHYPTYGFSLTLNLPVKNRSAEAALDTASVNKRNDLYLIRRQTQGIRLDVVNSVHQLEEAKLSLEASKSARELAQKVLQAEQHKYDLGASEIFLVLEAQSELTQAEVSLLQAQIDYQVALTSVGHATGDLLDRYHVQVQLLRR